MKTRESGMPDESMWNEFFDPVAILEALGVSDSCEDVVEFGCGYGTFTIAVAQMVRGTVFAIDIEADMAEAARAKASAAGLTNVQVLLRDFATEGTGLADNSVDYAMLFNILHCEDPKALLTEAYRVLRPGGCLGIIHWNYDPSTARGPSMEIRPKPEQCLAWAEFAGFRSDASSNIIDLPPYHYGLRMHKS